MTNKVHASLRGTGGGAATIDGHKGIKSFTRTAAGKFTVVLEYAVPRIDSIDLVTCECADAGLGSAYIVSHAADGITVTMQTSLNNVVADPTGLNYACIRHRN